MARCTKTTSSLGVVMSTRRLWDSSRTGPKHWTFVFTSTDARLNMKSKLFVFALLALGVSSAQAYVEIPYTLGRLVTESTHVMLVQVDKVDKTKNLVIYRKIKDIKGTHPADVIKHNIGQAGFSPKE